MKKNRLLICMLLVMAMLMVGCGEKEKKAIQLGTGGTGGNYYSYGSKLSESLSESSDYKMDVVTTQGSSANIRLLAQGYLDMALVQSDTLNDAINGTGKFANDPLSGFHSVTGLYTESCQIVVKADSKIENVEDLVGKKVSVGEKDSGALTNAMRILDAYGVKMSSLDASYLSYADAADALKNGEIDAFFCTASAPTTALVSLAEECEIRLLDLDQAIVKSVTRTDKAYVTSVIPAGTYKGQEEDIYSIGVTAVLVASDKLSEDAVNAVLKVLEAHGEELQDVSFGVDVDAEDAEEGTFTIEFDMYMTLALAVLVLYIGAFLKKKINILEKFCIPAPVVGGLLFAVLSCVLYAFNIVEFSFDETLKTVCMIIFFTSVGFQANIKILKKGGLKLVVFLGCVIALIFCQNGLAVLFSKVLHVDSLVGLCTGSIPMVGGHGTAGAFGVVLEDLGQSGAITLCTAAATFGLIMGSLMGGPIGRRLILKNKLMDTVKVEDETVLIEEEVKHHRSVSMYAPAVYQLAIAMGVGTVVSMLLSKTGMTFPIYIGAMIVAAIMRNASEFSGKFTIHMGEINDVGGICLSLFLGIAMVTLKLWQLADLALPLFVLLTVQTVFMALFAYFVVYNICGRNYDAAVLSAGTCGFGMGATPNAMANMQALTEKFAPSVQAYILVPIVGSMFADFINSLVITFFINLV